MSLKKFEEEYEMRASQKILFPYLNSPGGLAQWFADDVKIDEDKFYRFFWNGEEQKARLAANRRDQFVRFEYLPETAGLAGVAVSAENPESGDTAAEDLPYIEFSLEKNEMTQSVFLRVTDYTSSGDEDEEEIYEIWESMIAGLKELIGG